MDHSLYRLKVLILLGLVDMQLFPLNSRTPHNPLFNKVSKWCVTFVSYEFLYTNDLKFNLSKSKFLK